MNKISRNVGMGLYSSIRSCGITVEDAAKRIGYSVRDLRRVLEGRLFLSPSELEKISNIFGTTSESLIAFVPDGNCLLPELEYNKEFSSNDNLHLIIDLLDEYIELKEQV